MAALVVVIHHLVLIFCEKLLSGDSSNWLIKFCALSPLNIFYNGNFAVCLFFTLSGYVLSYKYILSENWRILPVYAAKRYFRLLPLIAVSVIIGFIAIKYQWIKTVEVNNYSRTGPWLLELFIADVSSWTLVLKNILWGVLFQGENQYNCVVWSMKIEFLGSMFLFCFLLLNHRIRYKWILALIVTGLILYLQEFFYLCFLGGYYLCYLKESKRTEQNKYLLAWRSGTLKKWMYIPLVLIGIWWATYPAAWQFVETSAYKPLLVPGIDSFQLWHVMGSIVLLAIIVSSTRMQQKLAGKVCLYLGKYSFALYLLHLLVFVVLTNRLFLVFIMYLPYLPAILLALLLTLPLLWTAVVLASKYIDEPVVKLINQLSYKLEK